MAKRSELSEKSIHQRDLIDGLVKGIDVITAFNEEVTRLTASELAEKINLSRSAARRYLLTLVHLKLAATDGRNFWLTPHVLNLGGAYLDSARMPRAIVPFLQQLTLQLQESSNYSVIVGNDVVYISRVNGPRLLIRGFEPGTRLPAYTSTAGRVLLSALPDDELRTYLGSIDLIAYTHLTVTDKEQLFDELMQIRKNGFAATENQFEIGFRGISVPLKNRRGNLIGALSVSMLTSNGSMSEATARCVSALQATANTLMLWV